MSEPEDMLELARFLVANCDPSDEVQELAAELDRLGSPPEASPDEPEEGRERR